MTISNPSVTNSTPSTSSVFIRYGIIIGSINSVIGIVTMISNSSSNFFIGLIGFVLTIFLVVRANKEFKKLNGGYMSYGKGVIISFLTILISGIISSTITFIYLSYIDPSALEGIKQTKVEMMEKMANWFGAKLPEEKFEEAVEKIDEETTAFSQFKEGLTGTLFSGILLALIIAAFTKKTRPEFE